MGLNPTYPPVSTPTIYTPSSTYPPPPTFYPTAIPISGPHGPPHQAIPIPITNIQGLPSGIPISSTPQMEPGYYWSQQQHPMYSHSGNNNPFPVMAIPISNNQSDSTFPDPILHGDSSIQPSAPDEEVFENQIEGQ